MYTKRLLFIHLHDTITDLLLLMLLLLSTTLSSQITHRNVGIAIPYRDTYTNEWLNESNQIK